MQSQQRLLRGVLGVSEISEHPVGRRECRLTQRLKFFWAHLGTGFTQSPAAGFDASTSWVPVSRGVLLGVDPA